MLGRSAAQGSHAVQHLPSLPGHDNTFPTNEAQRLQGAAREKPPSLSSEALGQPTSPQKAQAEPGRASSSGASHAELRPHVSSSMTHGPLVHLGGTSDSALGRAGSGLGLSLSDGDASASVLSSLGDASDFDADVEHSIDAAELDVPEMTGQHLTQSPTATLAGAANHGGSSSASAPARRIIPSSPFQHGPEKDLQPSQAIASVNPSAEDSTGPEALPGPVPERALQPGLSEVSEEPSEVRSAASLQGRVSRTIQAASSDLMEAWNEQEQLEKQSNAASQLHSRLGLEESDLALSDLAELEQASSVLDSMVESTEMMQPQHSSVVPAPQQSLDSHRYELDWSADDAIHAERQQSSMQSQISDGAELDQEQLQHNDAGSGPSPPEYARKQSSAGSFAEDSVPMGNLSHASMQPGTDYNSAAHRPSPSISSAGETALGDGTMVDPISDAPTAETLRPRPADNAFREGHEPESARWQSRSNVHLDTDSAEGASLEHDQRSDNSSRSLAKPLEIAAEQSLGQLSLTQEHSGDEKPDSKSALDSPHKAEYVMNKHEQPPLAVSDRAAHQQHAAEPAGERGHAEVPLQSEPESAVRADKAAGLGLGGADRLAYAEALERALATGVCLATDCLIAGMAHTIHPPHPAGIHVHLRSLCGHGVLCDHAASHAHTEHTDCGLRCRKPVGGCCSAHH